MTRQSACHWISFNWHKDAADCRFHSFESMEKVREDNDLHYLKLVKNPSLKDRLVKKAFLTYLRLKGLKTKPPTLKLDKDGNNHNVFRKQSLSYEENGETIYRHIDCKEELYDYIEGVGTLTDLIQRSFASYAEKKFLGVRQIKNQQDESSNSSSKSPYKYQLEDFDWITYSQAQVQLNNLSLLFYNNGFNDQVRMAIFTDTSPTWYLTAHALFQIKSPVITIYSSLSDEGIIHALNEAEVKGVLVDKKSGPRLLKILHQIPSINLLFCTPNSCIDLSESSVDSHVKFINITSSILDKPLADEDVDKIKLLKPVPSDIAFIMFTSGSTGSPKGVILTHGNIVSSVSVTKNDKHLWENQTYLAYLPQAHILEFIAETVMTMYGSCIGFGHIATLFDDGPMLMPGCKGDLKALRPTFFATVPLLLDRLMKGSLQKIRSAPSTKQIIFETAYNLRLAYLKVGINTPVLDFVFRPMYDVLGGRVACGYLGGAAIPLETEYFIYCCFSLIKQGYGLTETCSAGALSDLDYMKPGNAGPITKCIELKFIPWEEGGYHPNDPEGPRGEILLSGKCVSSGYFKRPDLTEESFIKDESTGKIWFKTGDIGAMLPDGTVRIIDRKKDIIKLKNGEYISLAGVEDFIIRSEYVDFVCTAPNSTSDFLVALIIPKQTSVMEICKEMNKDTNVSYQELLADSSVCQMIKDRIIEKITQIGVLNKYEMPKVFHILPDAWTPESNLITASAKLRRPAISAKYRDLLK